MKICKPNAVLYFNCDDETLKDRLLERGKTSGRADDNIDTILNRLETYRNVSMPVVDMYKESDGDLIHEVCIIKVFKFYIYINYYLNIFLITLILNFLKTLKYTYLNL